MVNTPMDCERVLEAATQTSGPQVPRCLGGLQKGRFIGASDGTRNPP